MYVPIKLIRVQTLVTMYAGDSSEKFSYGIFLSDLIKINKFEVICRMYPIWWHDRCLNIIINRDIFIKIYKKVMFNANCRGSFSGG